jgi:spermidine synthase
VTLGIDEKPVTEQGGAKGHGFLVLAGLCLLFAGSGCSALIYEIVWYQLLQLAIGSTALSLGLLLASFMGGLCIGSLAQPRLFRHAHPLRLYAVIEAGIALFGLAELVVIPLVLKIYMAGGADGVFDIVLRALICMICLLPPTILMGASLPAIARLFHGNAAGATRWGLLYGANIAGAVLGCVAAGFYLLRLTDTVVTSLAAVAINLIVAGLGLVMAKRLVAPASSPAPAPPRLAHFDSVLLATALSGAAALGGEVVWTRLMGLTFGATVYAFSIILAVFLVGLALGTGIGSGLGRIANPRRMLALSQLAAAAGTAWAAYMIAVKIPYWNVDPGLVAGPWRVFWLDIMRAGLALLPVTLAWGASFPLAFAALADANKDSGAQVGAVYAANTFGAILGALGVSLLAIPLLGTAGSEKLVLLACGGAAMILLLPRDNEGLWRLGLALAAMLMAVGLGRTVQPVPGELIAYGRRTPSNHGFSTILFTAEGRNSSIAVSRWHQDNSLQFHVSGKVEASTNPDDMRLQRMLGHLSALIHKNPQSVLVVGFGAGVTAGSFTTYPEVKHITICEMEPLIPPVSTQWFKPQNYDVMHDPRTRIVYDDARHFIATTTQKFDIITSDPIHPFVKGSAALYSRDYYEMVKAHLNPGGVVTQWVPLYESDLATVKSEIATFFAVFPHAFIYANTAGGLGYDLVLVGQVTAPPINLDALAVRANTPAYAKVRDSLTDVGFASTDDLLATYTGAKGDFGHWIQGAQINTDRDMRLQYLAGMAVNHSEEDAIYRSLRAAAKPPGEAVFIGNPDHRRILQAKIAAGPQTGNNDGD